MVIKKKFRTKRTYTRPNYDQMTNGWVNGEIEDGTKLGEALAREGEDWLGET